MSQVVFAFREGRPETRTSAIRGGKGSGLAELVSIGMPVPAGFTITTGVCRSFAQENRLPERLLNQLHRSLLQLEKDTGKQFGGSLNPLLLSVRSGARVSMPGMMDTILNVGLNRNNIEAFGRLYGRRFAYDSYRRLLSMYGQTVLGIDKANFRSNEPTNLEQTIELVDLYEAVIEEICEPLPADPLEQLMRAIFAVFESWNSERAVAYRNDQNIPNWWGTAVTVQSMVFGNKNEQSATGVVFSRNPLTGNPELYGEFLPNAQGEDVVAGIRTPIPIEQMSDWNPRVADELRRKVKTLEEHFNDMVDVEFTVEDSQLFILQCRSAKRTTEAAAAFVVQQAWEGQLTRKEAILQAPFEELALTTFSEEAKATACSVTKGLAASPGVVVGRAVFTIETAKQYAGTPLVLFRPDTSPDDLPAMLLAKAVVTGTGGATSHAAVVARALNKPAVVGCGGDFAFDDSGVLWLSDGPISEGDVVSVDGNSGVIYRGELQMVEKPLNRELKSLRSWTRRFQDRPPAPRIDFDSLNRTANANTLLNGFYLIESMIRSSRKSKLVVQVSKLKAQLQTQVAEAFACYLLIACAGELRHTPSCAKLEPHQVKAFDVLKDKHKLPLDQARRNTQTAMVNRLAKCSHSDQVEFFELAAVVFSQGWSSAYGGPAWERIARAPYNFLSGNFNHSVFVDHVFDLQHNGGRLFDKHPMFECDDDRLKTQLDKKKEAKDTAALHRQLTQIHKKLPESVNTIWLTGRAEGLW